MKLDKITVTPFKFELNKPFKTASRIFSHRTGWYVYLESNDITGVGEIAPLKGFSPDFNKPIISKINDLKLKINQLNNDFCEEEYLSILYENSIEYPSVCFGFETALYDLLSQRSNLPISRFWNKNAIKIVAINSVCDIKNPVIDDQIVIKLKMTLESISKSIGILEKIIEENPDLQLRLDFNGNLDLPSAIKWCRKLSHLPVDYIEQPLPSDALEDLSELRIHTEIPIAVDESLTDVSSAEHIIEKQAADVFIIKPMISGGYRNTKEISDLGKMENIRTIITSALETNIGLMANYHIASALEISEHCGLSTWKLYGKNPFISTKSDKINISKNTGLRITP